MWVCASAYYLFLITNGTFDLFAREEGGLTFNDMASRLLQWDFTIGDSVENEGYVRDGRTYSYFGIFPALLRIPLLLMIDIKHTYISRLSCWAALTICCLLMLRIVSVVCKGSVRTRWGDCVSLCSKVALAFGAPALSMTFTSWVYNEPILWGTLWSLSFTLLLVHRIEAGRSLSRSDAIALGLFSGLALASRPTSGTALAIGLATFGIAALFPVSQIRKFIGCAERRENDQPPLRGVIAVVVGSIFQVARSKLAFSLLACIPLFAAVLFVNYQRWRQPFTFMPIEFNLLVQS